MVNNTHMKFKQFYNSLLLEYTDTHMPKVFAALRNSDNPLACIHFSHSTQISLNPRPAHHDPIGVYGFLKDYITSNGLQNNTGFASMPYIFVLQPNKNARILRLNMDKEQAEELLDKAGIDPKLLYSDNVYHKSVGKEDMEIGHRFWGALEHYRSINSLSKNSSWNTIFKKMGYNVLVDDGGGIIHSNEKSQIVFLEPSTYTVIDVIQNNSAALIQSIIKSFPEFKVTNRSKGGASHRTLSYYFDSKEHYFNVHISPINNDVDIIVDGDIRIRYSSWRKEEDISKMVEAIRQAIDKSTYVNDAYNPNTTVIDNIAKLYGLAKKKGSLSIERTYPQNDTLIHLSVNYYPKSKYSPESLTLVLSRRRRYDAYYSGGAYHYTAMTDNVNADNISSTVDSLFDELNETIQKDLNKEDIVQARNASDAAKHLQYIRRQVFRKRGNIELPIER